MKILTFGAAYCIVLSCIAFKQHRSGTVVQFDIHKILNARPVTIVTNGKSVPWEKGIDGDGAADGYSTYSAALVNGDKNPHALPDNPVFAANEAHPEIKLYYANGDSVHKQAFAIIGEGGTDFPVPANKYSIVYLALLSAQGTTALHVKFIYSNSTEEYDFVVPDYYWDIPANDPNYCYLAHDMAKWNNKGKMAEKDHHNIDLLKLHPDPLKTLKRITFSKTKPGYLVFWAATGVKAE